MWPEPGEYRVRSTSEWSGIVSDVAAPLGGAKGNGLGREGGVLGIEEFFDYKYAFLPNG